MIKNKIETGLMTEGMVPLHIFLRLCFLIFKHLVISTCASLKWRRRIYLRIAKTWDAVMIEVERSNGTTHQHQQQTARVKGSFQGFRSVIIIPVVTGNLLVLVHHLLLLVKTNVRICMRGEVEQIGVVSIRSNGNSK